MKTPEEIKTALRDCGNDDCRGCAYGDNWAVCQRRMELDALEYIEKLEVISNVTMPGASKEGDNENARRD